MATGRPLPTRGTRAGRRRGGGSPRGRGWIWARRWRGESVSTGAVSPAPRPATRRGLRPRRVSPAAVRTEGRPRLRGPMPTKDFDEPTQSQRMRREATVHARRGPTSTHARATDEGMMKPQPCEGTAYMYQLACTVKFTAHTGGSLFVGNNVGGGRCLELAGKPLLEPTHPAAAVNVHPAQPAQRTRPCAARVALYS